MIELLSLHVSDAYQCRLISNKPFWGDQGPTPVGVAQRMLCMLGLNYDNPTASDLLIAQIKSPYNLSGVSIMIWDHHLAIEASASAASFTGPNVLTLAKAADAWDAMRLIAAHCDIDMPRFSFTAL